MTKFSKLLITETERVSIEKIHRRKESTTAPLSAVFEFWKDVIYFRVNVNYTSAPRPVSLVLPLTVCSMRVNEDKFVYLVCVQTVYVCRLCICADCVCVQIVYVCRLCICADCVCVQIEVCFTLQGTVLR